MLVKKHLIDELRARLDELQDANRKDVTKEFAVRATAIELNEAIDVIFNIFTSLIVVLWYFLA